ncbi:MAG TPA: Tol-Pal system beta propeller repeat protein TolB [Syntrophales bacterium]|nr:Tol-Pal system beta propeller repeat protein TolB [Syntrophales bacterium]
MKLLTKFLTVAMLCAASLPGAHAALTIEITQGMEGALPIAIVPFDWDGPMPEAPLDIAGVITTDLYRSGRFSPLPEKDFLARPHEGSQINFTNWRILGIENLVVGRLRATGNEYVVQFQLFDVFRTTQLTGYSIRSSAQDLRYTAHQISDIIYEALMGEKGDFATRIAYVTELRSSSGARRYSLQVADSDGYDPRPVLNSTQPIMSPAWSPDGSRIAYVSFENGRPHIFIQDVRSGKRELVSSNTGLNGAPAWSPDGTRLALVLSKDGSPDIYVLTLGNKKLLRLTSNYAIDTEPVWTPNGNAIIFTSDRGGQPQIYRIAVSGGREERLTFEGAYNARPVLSPDGKLLAMVHGENGIYNIAAMEMDTGAMRVLTDAKLDESPSFAPNGSMIIYATEDRNRGVLQAVSVDGRVRQRLFLQQGDAREPAWSPYYK